eukprot:scaffold19638_cov68-Phaeocystis_antarctica.AAC.3
MLATAFACTAALHGPSHHRTPVASRAAVSHIAAIATALPPRVPTETIDGANRALEYAARRSPMILVVGGVYIDELHAMPGFPTEDSQQQAISVTRRRGGNAATTSCVVAQLAPPDATVQWMGTLPAPGAGDDSGVEFVLSSLNDHGVDTALTELVTPPTPGGFLGVPTATIILSAATGSRTIISSRRGLAEVSPAWFSAKLTEVLASSGSLVRPGWIHLETREYSSVVQLARHAREALTARASGPGSAAAAWKLSVEIEEVGVSVAEALELCACADVAFFSRDWAKKHAAELLGADDAADGDEHEALRLLRQLASRVGPHASTLVCAWGAQGAFALARSEPTRSSGPASQRWEPAFEPAVPVEHVVDSTGAGDSFNAGVITALAAGCPVSVALRDACAVAGQKVQQDGFYGLAEALPADGSRARWAVLDGIYA